MHSHDSVVVVPAALANDTYKRGYAMNELKSFLERMGGLHDAVIRQLVWEPEAKILRFEIEDLYSNFEGLPEYPGAVSGLIELQGVERIGFDIKTNEKRLNIYEFFVEIEGTDKYQATISFWPTGRITASYRIANLLVPKNQRENLGKWGIF